MILIVGAGISGLFTGYNLYKKGIKFIILEKQNIGGKIQSLKYGDSIIESGPSICHSNQKNILTLCKELGIKLKNTSSKFYSYSNMIKTQQLQYKSPIFKVKDILSVNDTSTFRESEYMFYNDWLTSVTKEGKYMYVEGGFITIINALYNKLKKYIYKGEIIKIYNGQSDTLPIMVEIKSDKNIKKTTFYKIIFCTTMKQLYNIKFEKQILNPTNIYTKTMESLRVYVILDKPISHLNNIFSKYNVIYNKDFGLTIKISEYIILLIYTDGNHTFKMSKKENIDTVAKFYSLDKNIIDTKIYLYKDAFDVVISHKNLNYKLENRIYQSAFPDRYNQAWLEGNLIQCKKILDCLC
jgi:hypothetical protein